MMTLTRCGQTDRQTNRQTDKQTNRQTDLAVELTSPFGRGQLKILTDFYHMTSNTQKNSVPIVVMGLTRDI